MEQIEPLNILIIDDEPDTSTILSEIIRRAFSAQMQTATDCASARKLFHKSNFDLITLDYQLPDGNGLELLEEINSMENPPKVIMVTGHGDEQVAGQCFKLGASGYIVKDNRLSVMLPEAIEHVISEISLERAEKEVLEARKKVKEYLDVASVIILGFNDKAEITLVNRKGCELIGLPESEILGRVTFDLFIPEYYREQAVRDFEQTVLTGKIFSDTYESPLIAADGSERTIAWKNTLFKNEEGHVVGFLVSGEDITERQVSKKIANAQREISVRLASIDDIFEGLRIAFGIILDVTGLDCGRLYIKDINTGALDLVYHQGLLNNFVNEVNRYDAESPNAKLVDERKTIYARYSDLVTEEAPSEIEEALKAIAIVPIIHKDNVVGCLNVASHTLDEISEDSKRAIETLSGQIAQVVTRASLSNALKESEATYRALFNSAPEAIALFDIQGKVKDINEATCNWLGYPKEEILGKMVHEMPFIPEEKKEETLELFTRGISGEQLSSIVVEHLTKNGETYYGNVAPTFIKDDSGEIIGAMVITTDITNRIHKEEALEEYERQYRLLFENTNECILIIDPDSRIASANPAAVNGLGYQNEAELIGTRYQDLVLESRDLDTLMKNIIANGALRDVEVTYKRKDGSPLYAIGSAELFLDESGDPLSAETVFSDITRLKEAEKALKESEELFRTVFQQSEIGMALIDVKKAKIIRANEALVRITGYSMKELLSIDYADTIYPEDVEMVMDRAHAFYDGDMPTMRLRTRILRKDNSTAWLDLSTAIVEIESGTVYAIGSAIDVTEQKLAEEELRFAKELWERSFEELADGVVLINPDFGVVECNKAFSNLVRKGREEIIGNKCYHLVHGTDKPPDFCVCKEVKKHKKVMRAEVYESNLKRNLEIAATPILNPDGKIEQIVHVMHDITNRRKTEEELLKHREHLEELVGDRTAELKSVNKRLTEEIIWRTKVELDLKRANTELEDYAHTVSHDLKGPLSSISLSADMLLDEAANIENPETRKEIHELVGSIKRHAGKSFKLADDLLDLSRAGNIPEKVEEVDIKTVVTEILDERRSKIKEKGIVFKIDDDMGKVQADSTQIYVLFSNIIWNAIIHNDNNKPEVTVSYKGHDSDGHKYLIRDNGSGINAGEEENIFRAFHKGPVSEGTGVGLATAMKIVDVYSGEIKAYNKKGACIEFTIKDFHP